MVKLDGRRAQATDSGLREIVMKDVMHLSWRMWILGRQPDFSSNFMVLDMKGEPRCGLKRTSRQEGQSVGGCVQPHAARQTVDNARTSLTFSEPDSRYLPHTPSTKPRPPYLIVFTPALFMHSRRWATQTRHL
jgi:hypothetical protein